MRRIVAICAAAVLSVFVAFQIVGWVNRHSESASAAPAVGIVEGFLYSAARDGTLAVLEVDPSGSATPILGSPFSSGGLSPNGIAVEASVFPSDVFVLNSDSQTVSVFNTDIASGAPSPAAGSPFPTGAAAGTWASGLDLFDSGSSKCLYVNNNEEVVNTISAFLVQDDIPFLVPDGGSLIPVPGFPLDVGGSGDPRDLSLGKAMAGIKVGEDSGRLFAANRGSKNISVFDIGVGCSLAPVPGSPFSSGSLGKISSLGINRDETLLFVTNTDGANDVSVLSIAATGELTPAPGSPFSSTQPVPANPVSHPLLPFLYIGNAQGGAGLIEVFDIAGSGALSSPRTFSTSFPNGLAVSFTFARDAGQVTVALYGAGSVDVFNVGSDGSLTLVPGSPFPTGQSLVMDVEFIFLLPVSVGGIAEALVDGGEASAPTAGGSGSSAGLYAAIAGGVAGAAVAIGAGGWYARRRIRQMRI